MWRAPPEAMTKPTPMSSSRRRRSRRPPRQPDSIRLFTVKDVGELRAIVEYTPQISDTGWVLQGVREGAEKVLGGILFSPYDAKGRIMSMRYIGRALGDTRSDGGKKKLLSMAKTSLKKPFLVKVDENEVPVYKAHGFIILSRDRDTKRVTLIWVPQ